jgi:hypothetical protein
MMVAVVVAVETGESWSSVPSSPSLSSFTAILVPLAGGGVAVGGEGAAVGSGSDGAVAGSDGGCSVESCFCDGGATCAHAGALAASRWWWRPGF